MASIYYCTGYGNMIHAKRNSNLFHGANVLDIWVCACVQLYKDDYISVDFNLKGPTYSGKEYEKLHVTFFSLSNTKQQTQWK